MTFQVAIYARVSTLNQAHAQTIDQQIERLSAYILEQGWQLSDEQIYRDDGRSGSDLNRPGLDRLRDAVRMGEVHRVLITEPDRLARNYVQQMIVLDELEHLGCQVEFLDRPMSDDPHDRLLLQIRGAVAEYERTLIADRMRRGRQMKYQAGLLLPWTKPPYGYRLSPDRPRDPTGVWVDEAEAAIVREIFAWYASDGSSLYALAERLHSQGVPTPSGKRLWSISTLRAILRQPAYLGQVYACRHRYRPAQVRRSATHPIGRPHDSLVERPEEEWIPVGTVPTLVTQEQFDLVQARLAQNQSFASRNNKVHSYLLRALVSCGFCQSSCTARHLKGGYSYYTCAAKANAVHSRKEEKCPACFSRADQLDELVWRDLCELLTHPGCIAQAMARALGGDWLPQELQSRREQVRGAKHRLGQQLERLTEAYLGSVIPLAEYQRRRQDLEQKLAGLANQESQLAIQVDRQQELVGLVASVENFCQRVQAGLTEATFEQKRELVELLIDRVIVANGDVEIRYAIPTSPESERVRFCHLRLDYFAAPDLIEALADEVVDQVREAAVRVLAVGRAAEPLDQEALLAHNPQDPLVIRLEPSPLEFNGHPSVAVPRKLEGYLLDGVT